MESLRGWQYGKLGDHESGLKSPYSVPRLTSLFLQVFRDLKFIFTSPLRFEGSALRLLISFSSYFISGHTDRTFIGLGIKSKVAQNRNFNSNRQNWFSTTLEKDETLNCRVKLEGDYPSESTFCDTSSAYAPTGLADPCFVLDEFV